MNEATILTSLLMASSVVATILWICQETKIDYAPPRERIDARIYRHFQGARNALFHGSRDVRFTIFTPDPNEADTLHPIARFGWGRAAAHSGARFRKGEGIAGIAWENVNAIVVATLGPFDDEKTSRQAQKEILRLSAVTAETLSSDQLRAQVIIATRLDCADLFRGVLCIDCLNPKLVPVGPDGDKDRFWLDIARLGAEVAALLRPSVEPHVALRNVRSVRGASLVEIRFDKAMT